MADFGPSIDRFSATFPPPTPRLHPLWLGRTVTPWPPPRCPVRPKPPPPLAWSDGYSVVCRVGLGARQGGGRRTSVCGLRTEPAPAHGFQRPGSGTLRLLTAGARSGPTRGFAQDTLQSGGGCRRLTYGLKAGGRVPGRGRSLIGAPHGFVRPGDSGFGPKGGPPNPHLGTAPVTREELSINVSTYSASDPTRHGREGNWARMREPIPHPITAEGQREDLGIVRAAHSAMGGEGGGETAEGKVRKRRRGR
jgi:hypothetical protein